MYWTPYCKGMGKVQPAAWGICNPKVNKKTRWKLLESCVMLRLVYGLHQACFPKKEMKKIESCWFQLSRSMVKGGWRRVSEDPKDIDFRFVYRNNDLQRIIGIKSIKDFFLGHHLRYLGHVCRDENTAITKKMMFAYARSMGEDCWKLRYEPNSTSAGYLGPGGFQEVHQITDGPTSTAMKLAIWRNYKLVICIA